MSSRRQPLAELLLEAKLVSQETLDGLEPEQREDERRLGAILVERKLVSPARLAQVVSHQMSLPWISLEKVEFKKALLKLIPKKVAYRHHVIPVYMRGSGDDATLYVAIDDPTRDEAVAACREACGLEVRLMVASPNDVRVAIETHYGRRTSMVMRAVQFPVVGAAGLPMPDAPRRPPPPPPPVSMRQPPTPSPSPAAAEDVEEALEEEADDSDLLDDEADDDDPIHDAVTAEPPEVATPEPAPVVAPERETPIPSGPPPSPPSEEHELDELPPVEAPPTTRGDEAAMRAMAARVDEALDESRWAEDLDDDSPFPEEPPESFPSDPPPSLPPPTTPSLPLEPTPSPPVAEASPAEASPVTRASSRPEARKRPPVVLLVNPPPGFVDTCAAIAAALPARVEAVSLSEANTRALATVPIVIVVTDDVYEFDRLAFNQLAMAVGAPLVVWSEDLDPEDLEPVLTMAYRASRGG